MPEKIAEPPEVRARVPDIRGEMPDVRGGMPAVIGGVDEQRASARDGSYSDARPRDNLSGMPSPVSRPASSG